jgi:hypothetical protein
VQLSNRDIPDLLRSAGGLLLATGAVVLLVRKSSHHGWSDFALLLVVLLPAVVLYALALGGAERGPAESAQPWRSVLLVSAILLGPVVFYEFLHWAGASTRHPLYSAGVFTLTGLLAAYGARRARVPYAALLAGLALLVAWLIVWGRILNHPSADTYRWLLVAGAVLLFLVSVRLARSGAIGSSEIATAGGIATVAAGVLGVIVGSFVGVFRGFATAIEGPGAIEASSSVSSGGHIPYVASGALIPSKSHFPHVLSTPHIHRQISPVPHIPSSPHIFPHSLITHVSGLQHFGWDLYLLIASLALVWISSRARVRGLAYVGGAGLLAFLISVAAQITRLEAGHAPTHGILGWPLVLIITGVAGLAAPALMRRDS